MTNANFGDIDLDVRNRNDVLAIIEHTPASMIKDGVITQHNTGIYPQHVPIDPVTGLCSIDYNRAEELGYMKIDVLNVSAYQNIKDEQHLQELISKEPMWDLLEHKEIVDKLPHIHDHFDIVSKMKPQSVEQLAAVLAIIRPAKRKLLGKSWTEVEAEVWTKDANDKFAFKKAHAYSYALLIVAQLNLLIEGLEDAAS